MSHSIASVRADGQTVGPGDCPRPDPEPGPTDGRRRADAGGWFIRKPVADLDARVNRLSVHDRRMLEVLEGYCRDKAYCWVGNDELAAAYGCRRRNVQLRLEGMEARGLIHRVPEAPGHPGRLGIILLARSDPDLPVADRDCLDQVEARLRHVLMVRREPDPGPLFRAQCAAPDRAQCAAPDRAQSAAPEERQRENQDVEESPTFNVGGQSLVACDESMDPGSPPTARDHEAFRLIEDLRSRGVRLYVDADGETVRRSHPKHVAGPTGAERASLRRLEPEVRAELRRRVPPAAVAKPAPKIPERRVQEIRGLIDRLGDERAESGCARLADALVSVFRDADVERSRAMYHGLARHVAGLAREAHGYDLPAWVVKAALDEANRAGVRKRGAAFTDAVKRIKARWLKDRGPRLPFGPDPGGDPRASPN